MTTAHTDVSSLHRVERGAGLPLVLVHGSASDHRTWSAQLPAFAERYRTVAYSRRYHWPNSPIPEGADYAMDEHLGDLGIVVRSLGEDPVHLVGHSYGGFVALLLAIRRPELVRKLVLIEPPVLTLFVGNVPRPAELLRLLLTRPRTAAAVIRFGARGIAPAVRRARRGDLDGATEVFARAVLGDRTFERLSPERREQARVNSCAAEFLGSGFPPVDDDDVRAVRAPVLLIDGRESPPIFHRINDRLEELLPDVRRIGMGGASHIVQEDEPAAFNAAVLEFLDEA